MLLLSNLTRNGTIGGLAARKLELGIQESEQLPQATMSRTSDERLDETPKEETYQRTVQANGKFEFGMVQARR